MFLSKVVEEIKIHMVCSITFLFQNCAFYEIVWKNLIEPEATDDNMAHAQDLGIGTIAPWLCGFLSYFIVYSLYYIYCKTHFLLSV
jgi:hypothetical protein